MRDLTERSIELSVECVGSEARGIIRGIMVTSHYRDIEPQARMG